MTETKASGTAVPELSSNIINDACWKFVETIPHRLPGPIFNDLKPALYAAVCHVLVNMEPPPGPAAVRDATLEETLSIVADVMRDDAINDSSEAVEIHRRIRERISAPSQAAPRSREEQQRTGKHPAPCARHCEANAFELEIRNLKARLAATSITPRPGALHSDPHVQIVIRIGNSVAGGIENKLAFQCARNQRAVLERMAAEAIDAAMRVGKEAEK